MAITNKETEWLRNRIAYLMRKQADLTDELHAAKIRADVMSVIAIVGWIVVVVQAVMS